MMRVTMESYRAEMKKEAEGIRRKGTEVRMQGRPLASSPLTNEINQKESEVRTVMGGIFGRRNHFSNLKSQILNLKSQISNLQSLRMALMAVLAVILIFSVAIPAYAAFDQLDDWSGYANNGKNFSPNWTAPNGSDGTSCWYTISGATPSNGVGPSQGNPDPYVYLETSGTGATNGCGVAGGSTQYFEEVNTHDAGLNKITLEFDWNMNLGGETDGSLYVDVWDGTQWVQGVTSAGVTGNPINTGDNGDVWVHEVIDLDAAGFNSGQIKVRFRYLVGNGTTWHYDFGLDNIHIYGVDRCNDPDPASITITAPTSGSTVSGTYTIQAQVTGETAPDTMTNMQVTIAGSSACDGTYPMTWNAGTSMWEYNWDTSACGTGTPETGITIDVSGNDPDCGDAVNATQVNNITIDNTGPKYTITSCSDCHDYPPTDATGQRNTPVGAVVGSHGKHPFDCSKCHIKPTTFDHRNGNIDMADPINGDTGASYSKGTSFPQVNDLTGSGLGTCSNVSCHGGSTTPKWGTTGALTCSSCHTNDMGLTATVRRGIYKAGNDFTKTSHHIAGTPADASCEVCHNKSNHTQEGDPKVRLFDEDTGTAILYDGTGGSLEGFCVSCHDSDAASRLGANATKPFTDSGDNTPPPDIGWNSAQAAHSALSEKCMACHGNSGAAGTTLDPVINAHGSDSAKLLRYTGWTTTDESGFCYNCHGNPTANGAQDDIQSMFAKTNSHSVQNCGDCHNKHMATPANKINGASGLSPSNGGNWSVPTSYTQVTVDDPFKQYQVCFKCHSDYNGGPPGSTTNVALEFNVNNYSYHYVEGDITTAAALPTNGSGCNSYGPNAGSTQIPRASTTYGNFNHTYIGKMEPSLAGLTDAQIRQAKLKCSSCHGPDGAGGTIPEGPHGSAYQFILKVPAGSPYTQWNNSVNYKNNGGSIWCFNCHDPNFTNTGFVAGGRDRHTSKHDGRACQYCHVAIPHGWKRYRLLRFDDCDSAPYVGRTGGLRSGVNWKTSGNWRENDCHNAAVAGCG